MLLFLCDPVLKSRRLRDRMGDLKGVEETVSVLSEISALTQRKCAEMYWIEVKSSEIGDTFGAFNGTYRSFI